VTSALSGWGGLALAAFLASLLVTRLIERYAPAMKLIDRPNARSSHTAPHPRGGGLAIVFGVAVAVIGATTLGGALPRDVWLILMASGLVALLGLWDDLRSLSVLPRLLIQTGVALLVVVRTGGFDRFPLPPPLDVPLGLLSAIAAVVWLVGVTNFVNFMDGVDGLASGQAVITFAALTWVLFPSPAAGLAVVAAAASAGFLLRNWSPAHIFLGDVGSGFLGFLMAALPLAVPAGQREKLVLLVATSLTLFLFDPVATLIVRARRGARVGVAHREHAYQRLIAPDRPHAAGVTALLLAGLALSIAAVLAYRSPALVWPSTGLALLVFATEWWIAARRR
jgi:glycosyltransferase WbpL